MIGKGLPSPWQELKNQIYMGSEQFVADMQQEIDLAQRLDEFPASQHRPPPPPLEHYASAAADRDAAILQAHHVVATPCKPSETTLACTTPE